MRGGDDRDVRGDDHETRSTDRSPSPHARAIQRLPFLLRIGAFVLVPVGFLGFLTMDVSPTDTSSPFTLLFAVGVVCAVLSIYLGIFLQDR